MPEHHDLRILGGVTSRQEHERMNLCEAACGPSAEA
jgi:hypothetical protein